MWLICSMPVVSNSRLLLTNIGCDAMFMSGLRFFVVSTPSFRSYGRPSTLCDLHLQGSGGDLRFRIARRFTQGDLR